MLAGVDDAAGVRDRIRAYLKEQADGGLGDDPARAAPRPSAGALAGPAVLVALHDMSAAARALRAAAERRPPSTTAAGG